MRKSKYTYELLAPIVAESTCLSDVMRSVGIKPSGGNFRMISHRLRALDIDISHFKGSNWRKGLTKENSIRVAEASSRQTVPNSEVFVENCRRMIAGAKVAKRLRKLGRPYLCEVCGLTDWLGQAITLHLDHINGVNNDHRFENLRFLCPNCHQQTDTWGNRKLRETLLAWG